MALWICQGWRIPETGLKQSIWSPKQAMFCSCILVARAFGKENQGQQFRVSNITDLLHSLLLFQIYNFHTTRPCLKLILSIVILRV